MPAVGSTAPDFALPDVHGTPVQVPDPQGEALLVVFIPFAFSQVCTDELSQLQASQHTFAAAGVHVVAISCDPMFSLRAWAGQQGFDFDLLSDFWPHGRVSARYGVFDPTAGYAHRGSVLIDGAGVVRWRILGERGSARPVAGYRKAIAGLGRAAGAEQQQAR